MSNDKRNLPVSIPDFDAGMEYLAQLPLANPILAEQKLAHFLNALQGGHLTPDEMFRLLEQARVSQCFVAEELARSYYNKALPLAADELAAFQLVLRAWRRMEKAYAACARAQQPATASPQYRNFVATVLHRCIHYVGAVIVEHYRARQELPKGLWLELHGYFATAEEWGVATEPVSDALDTAGQLAHCAGAYITLLLTDVASPYSHGLRDLNLIRRWAGMWAPLVTILPLDEHQAPPSYIVDLDKDAALHPFPKVAPTAAIRRLDTSKLGMKISHVLEQLRQKISPTRLGLGEETYGNATQMLEYLVRPWLQGESPRRFRRFSTIGTAKVVSGIEAMYFHIANQVFGQPLAPPAYTRRDYDHMFIFGERVESDVPAALQPEPEFGFEEWGVLNHSANGFRLSRTINGERLMHSQLIAMQPHDGDQFILAMVTWLLQRGESGGLDMGIHTLPGVPLGVGVRMMVAGAPSNEKFIPAFLLPGLPAMKEEQSLVLSSGLYQASRQLEVHSGNGNLWQARMVHVLQRGTGFDRVSYQVL